MPKSLATSLLLFLITTRLAAQSVAAPPVASSVGLLNDWLRSDAAGFTPWDFGGSARFRGEFKEGFLIAGAPGSLDFRDHGADVNNEYFLGRIRLHAGYTNAWWGAYLEGQSSFAANDQRFAYANSPVVPGTVRRQGDGPESDTADLHQGYVTLGNLAQFPLSLQVGRQELTYGEERLIGAFGWNNIGRTFDAAKLRWQNDWVKADLFTSRPVVPEDGRFDVSNDYDWFSGLYATSPRIPKTVLDLYFLARNSSPQAIAAAPSPQFPQPSARDIYTIGGRLKSKPLELGNWDYLLDGAYQFGDFRDLRLGGNSPRLTQNAYMYVAEAGYTFAEAWGQPRLGLEYDFSSGDSNPTDGQHETFDNLFPTNHKFYGYMDFVSLQNIHDLRGTLQVKPHPRLSLAFEGHGFWLADTHDSFYTVAGVPRGGIGATPGNGYGINPGYGNFVGTELDIVANFALASFAQFEMGYGHFFTGDYIRHSLSAPTEGSRDADYLYLQVTLGF